MPIDYQKGKIYGIYRDDEETPIYIGSTTQTITGRFTKHINSFKNKGKSSYKFYKYMNEYGYDNLYPKLIEECPSENLKQMYVREGIYIKKFNTIENGLNQVLPGRSTKERMFEKKDEMKEYNSKYYEEHKTAQLAKQKIFRDNNKELIAARKHKDYIENKEKRLQTKREYYYKNHETLKQKNRENYEKNKETQNAIIECECGGRYSLSRKSRHFKTDKHRDFIGDTSTDTATKLITCDCGAEIQHHSIYRHAKSIKHKNYLASLETPK